MLQSVAGIEPDKRRKYGSEMRLKGSTITFDAPGDAQNARRWLVDIKDATVEWVEHTPVLTFPNDAAALKALKQLVQRSIETGYWRVARD